MIYYVLDYVITGMFAINHLKSPFSLLKGKIRQISYLSMISILNYFSMGRLLYLKYIVRLRICLIQTYSECISYILIVHRDEFHSRERAILFLQSKYHQLYCQNYCQKF